MWKGFKITDLLYYIGAVASIIFSIKSKTFLDVIFYLLIALMIGVVIARLLIIEFRGRDIVIYLVRMILKVMTITLFFQAVDLFGTNYLTNSIMSAFLWGVFVYIRLANEYQKREHRYQGDDAWRLYQHAQENKNTDKQQEVPKKKQMTPFQKSTYFKACTNEEELKDQYRNLVKQYHPDNPNGDAKIFIKINHEYEKLQKYAKTHEKHAE